MNSLRGAVPFEADGEHLFLRLTTNAQVRYQDATGESLQAALKALTDIVRETQDEHAVLPRVRRIFAAGLSHMDGMTEEKAGDIMDAVGQVQSVNLIFDAIRAASPQPAGGTEGNVPPAKSRRKPKAKATAEG